MKVESISIQRFKLFEEFELAFKNKTLQEVSNRFLVLGDNGKDAKAQRLKSRKIQFPKEHVECPAKFFSRQYSSRLRVFAVKCMNNPG